MSDVTVSIGGRRYESYRRMYRVAQKLAGRRHR